MSCPRPRPTRGRTASVLLVGCLLVAACGGDDDAETVDTPVDTAPTTTAPPETTRPPETTEAVETTEPAVEEPTVFTSADLLDALPTVDDLGDPWWMLDGDEADIDPPAGEGFGVGTCGGPNAIGRATPHGLTGAAQSVVVLQDDERAASTTVYAFADADGASRFLQSTAEFIDCEDGVTWERVQRTFDPGPDDYSGFEPGFEEVVDGEIWTFVEFGFSAYLEVADLGADEVLLLAVEQDRELTAAGITFGETRSLVGRYARYGNVVVTTQLLGDHAHRGYLNLDDLNEFDPEFDDLEEYTIVVEPLVVERLGLSG